MKKKSGDKPSEGNFLYLGCILISKERQGQEKFSKELLKHWSNNKIHHFLKWEFFENQAHFEMSKRNNIPNVTTKIYQEKNERSHTNVNRKLP